MQFLTYKVTASIKCESIWSTPALKHYIYEQTCCSGIVVALGSAGNMICVFRRRLYVQISDIYLIKIHIWKCPRSDTEKSDLVQIFEFTRVQQILICVRCEQKKSKCASLNAAKETTTPPPPPLRNRFQMLDKNSSGGRWRWMEVMSVRWKRAWIPRITSSVENHTKRQVEQGDQDRDETFSAED